MWVCRKSYTHKYERLVPTVTGPLPLTKYSVERAGNEVLVGKVAARYQWYHVKKVTVVNEGARAPGTTEYDILQERRNGILEIVIVLGWKDWFNRYFPTENNHYF